jgi:predicted helicase
MRHLLTGENLALISARSNKSPAPDHFFCSRLIIEKKCGESTTQSSLFPLYLYPEAKKKDNPGHQNSMLSLCEPAVPFGRRANIDIRFLQEMADRLDLIFIPVGRGDLVATFGPEDVFYYAYAVFYSPTYRRRYAEFLKVDFPRLPLTRNQALFAALVGKGAELSGLHLMESPALGRLITAFPVSGSSVVDQVRYDGTQQRVYINEQQFFAGVAPQVWAFKIGGYQVLLKWLKDRRGRSLSFQDLQHYQRIVVAITETIRLMADIDAAIEAHGGWPLARAD